MDFLTSIGHLFGHPFGGDDGEKAAAQAAQQMAEYSRQRAVLEGQVKMARDQALQEKNRLDEKQVRSLRHSYSSDGLMSGLTDLTKPAASATSNVTGG